MHLTKTIGKREFIQHTSKYLKWVEEHGNELIITHHNRPDMILSKFKPKSLSDLQGLVEVKVQGDINDHVLPGYDKW